MGSSTNPIDEKTLVRKCLFWDNLDNRGNPTNCKIKYMINQAKSCQSTNAMIPPTLNDVCMNLLNLEGWRFWDLSAIGAIRLYNSTTAFRW